MRTVYRHCVCAFLLLALIVLLAMLASGEAHADPQEGWGLPVLIGGSPENSFNPDLAVGSGGLAIAAWGEFPGQSVATIFIPGEGWGNKVYLHEDRSYVAALPKVGVDEYGNALVVWREWTGDHYDPDMQLWCRQYSQLTGWGAPYMILEPVEDIDLSVADDGSAFCIYTVRVTDPVLGDVRHVLAIEYEPGVGWSSPSLISATDATSIESLQVRANSSGAVAVWSQRNWSAFHVWAASYVPMLGWDAYAFEDSYLNDSRYPVLALNRAGVGAVTWKRTSGDEPGLYYAPYDAGMWGLPSRIAAWGEGIGGHDAAFDDEGRGIAVWAWTANGTSRIWWSNYTSSGGWSAPSQLEDGPLGTIHRSSFPAVSNSLEPRVAMNGGGKAVAVWSAEGNYFGAGFSDVFTPGLGWKGTDFLGIFGTKHLIGVDGDGNAIAVWSFYANGTMANRLSNDTGVPSAVRSLTAVAGNHTVTLEWEAPFSDGGAPITHYNVYRCWGYEVMPLLATVPASQCNYTDSTPKNGEWFYYTVAAVSGTGEGLRYPLLEVLLPAEAPWAPRNLTATAGRDTVTLMWEPPANAAWTYIYMYRVYLQGHPYSRADVSGTTFTDTGLGVGSTYTYLVSAYNLDFEGPKSEPVTITTNSSATSKPGAPVGLVASARHAAALLSYEAVLSWSAPYDDGGTPITDYVVYRANASGDFVYSGHTGDGTQLSYVDTTVEMGKNYCYPRTYYYYVKAVNAVGTGPASFGTSVGIPGPLIEIMTPIPGDSWAINSTHFVTWALFLSSGPTVDIWLWRGGGNVTIAEDVPNGGLFEWKVPGSLEVGPGYRLVVFDPSLLDAVGVSGEFSIAAEGSSESLISAALEGDMTTSGWYASEVTVTLNVTLNFPAIWFMHYRLDGGAWELYVVPFEVNMSGAHVCEYRLESWNMTIAAANVTFSIDLEAPSLSILAPADGARLNRSSASVVLDCQDEHSGIASIRYKVDGEAWATGGASFQLTGLSEGAHEVLVNATDAAGRSREASSTFSVDVTAPTVLHFGPKGGWNWPNATVYCRFSEPMNASSVKIEGLAGALSWSGENLTLTPSAPLPLASSSTLTLTGQDEHGNRLVPLAWTFSTVANITGRVTGPTGAPVIGATVRLVSATEAERTATTDAEGRYNITCALGHYSLTVSAPGLSTKATDVEVGAFTGGFDVALTSSPSSSGLDYGVIAIVAFAVLAVLVGGATLARRRK